MAIDTTPYGERSPREGQADYPDTSYQNMAENLRAKVGSHPVFQALLGIILCACGENGQPISKTTHRIKAFVRKLIPQSSPHNI